MIIRFILLILIGIFILNSCKENQKNTFAASTNAGIDKNKLDSFILDKVQSIIYWEGSSPTINHNGSLKFQDGILYSKNKIIQAGELNIDMRTIANLDMQDPSDKADIENHLKSDDFFFVDSFPVSNFKMSSITMIKDTVFNAIIHGFLTIKNVTQPLKVRCKVDHTGDMIIVNIPEFTIDRTQFNILYQSKKLVNAIKDKFINDDITLRIILVAKKK